jgi:hypothetical protein
MWETEVFFKQHIIPYFQIEGGDVIDDGLGLL